MLSLYVVCWIFLQTFQTFFCIQTVWSSLIWVHTVCKNDFYNHKQMTKQTTIVVIGSLRIKLIFFQSLKKTCLGIYKRFFFFFYFIMNMYWGQSNE